MKFFSLSLFVFGIVNLLCSCSSETKRLSPEMVKENRKVGELIDYLPDHEQRKRNHELEPIPADLLAMDFDSLKGYINITSPFGNVENGIPVGFYKYTHDSLNRINGPGTVDPDFTIEVYDYNGKPDVYLATLKKNYAYIKNIKVMPSMDNALVMEENIPDNYKDYQLNLFLYDRFHIRVDAASFHKAVLLGLLEKMIPEKFAMFRTQGQYEIDNEALIGTWEPDSIDFRAYKLHPTPEVNNMLLKGVRDNFLSLTLEFRSNRYCYFSKGGNKDSCVYSIRDTKVRFLKGGYWTVDLATSPKLVMEYEDDGGFMYIHTHKK